MAEISKTPVSDFDAAVRLLSGGTNVAIYNDLGLPSVYVRREKGTIRDAIGFGPTETHYAFKVNGAEIPAFYMGKYLATVYKGRALSLPLQSPAADTVAVADCGAAANNNVSFDNAKLWCEANGPGFHLPTIAEYAWIALMSRKNGTMPHGNNSFGCDVTCNYEKGLASRYDSSGRINTTLTGSGPAKWNDNWKPDGICDLNGNVFEWQGGYRTVDGELQIFADNDAAMQYEQNKDSTRWKAILLDGSLVAPGTAGTLKWDYTETPGDTSSAYNIHLTTELKHQQATATPYGSSFFENLVCEDGESAPAILLALALMPSYDGCGNDYVFLRNLGECLSYRGGAWSNGQESGVFCTNSCSPRGYHYAYLGFRPAFIPGI